MDVGATAQWRKVTVFDPASGVALDALLAADFPPIIIRNGIILVPIAALSNVATMTPWVEGGVYNAGGGRYYIGFPDASWATKATTEIWGKSDTVEIAANPVEVGASLTAQETADASKLVPTGEMSSLFTGVTVAAIAAGLAAARGDITVVPITSTVSPGEVKSDDITAYLGSAKTYTFTIVDGDGVAVNLSGHAMRFTAAKHSEPKNILITHDGLTAYGADNNQVDVTLTGANTDTEQTLEYSLWDVTDPDPDNWEVLAEADLIIESVTQAQ